MTSNKNRDPNEIWFISEVAAEEPPEVGRVQLHKGRSPSVRLVRSLEDVQEDWSVVMSQVQILAAQSVDQPEASDMRVSEISVALGFDAKGRLAFLAEAGVSASLTVTLRRGP